MSSKLLKSKTIKVRNSQKFWQRTLGFLGGLGVLSTGLVIPTAIATEIITIPDAPAPSFVDSTPLPATPTVQPIAAPRPKVRAEATTQFRATRRRDYSQRAAIAAPKIKLAAPKISLSVSSPVISNNSPIETQPDSIRNSLQSKNSYIDTTNYSVAKPYTTDSAPAVVLTERSTGCQTIVQNGSLNRGCGSGMVSRRRSSQTNIARSFAPRYQRLASQTQVSPSSFIRRAPRNSPLNAIAIKPLSSRNYNYQTYRSNNVNPNQVVSLEPIIRRGLSIALAPMPEYNRATTNYAQTDPEVRQNNTDLLFPLPVVVPITSAFGWRIHPVSGTSRMHAGTDLGAPLGTPVLAAYDGKVATADWSGGYGLIVVLRHLEGTQESRYAHLSEVFVKPGQSVRKGEVIARVGSTGLSTGPHLHFEWRHLTNSGWVAVDTGNHLEYAMENLMRNQQLASAGPRPQS